MVEIGGEESNRRLYKRHVLEGKSHKGLVIDESINIENSNVTYRVYKKLKSSSFFISISLIVIFNIYKRQNRFQ